MLKAFFDVFEVTESQITKGALLRLRWASLLGLFALPSVFFFHILAPAAGAMGEVLRFIITGLCLAAWIFTGLSRICNRVWIPDRFLDESEIARKRESATFTYQIMVLIIVLATVLGLLMSQSGLPMPTFVAHPRFALFCLASLMTGSFALQTFKLTLITPAVDPAEGGAPELVRADHRYAVFTVLFALAVFLPMVWGL